MVSDSGRSPDDPYSWGIAASGTVAMVFTFGTPFSYGVFLAPFGEEFGLSSVVLTTVFSVELFVFFAGAGIIGIFATRTSSRKVLLASGLATAFLAPSLYVVDSYLGLLFVFATLGALLGTVFVVLAGVVPQWFQRRRGIATGLLFAGNGCSLLVLPPAWQYVFDRFGVRFGFALLVSLSGAMFLIAGLVCERPPWVDRSGSSFEELTEWIFQLVDSYRFRILFVSIAFAFAWYYLLAAYATDLFVARGMTDIVASTVFGLIGGVSILSRLGSGFVADRFGYRQTFLVSLLLAGVGCVALLLPYVSTLALAVFLFGIALGGVATLYIPILLQIYNPELDTAVVGVFNIGMGIFALVIPPVGRGLITHSGGYTGVISLTLSIVIASMGLFYRGVSEQNGR